MPSTLCWVLAVVVSCGLTAAISGEGKPPAADDAEIKTFVAHLARNGVQLERNEMGWWVVTDPKGDGYQVVVSLKSFPAGTSEKDMQAALRLINLAHTLNAPARLAMSRPGLQISNPGGMIPKLDSIPVAAKLEKLFKEYRPESRK